MEARTVGTASYAHKKSPLASSSRLSVHRGAPWVHQSLASATDSYREKSAIDSRRGGSDYWHTLVDDGVGTSGTGDGGSHHHVLMRQFSTEKQPALGCLELLLCQVAAGAQVVELRQLLTQR